MIDGLISVIDIAKEHGTRKQRVFKILKRLGIETRKARNSSKGNQLVAYITQDDFQRVSSELLLIANRTRPGQDEDEDEDGFVSTEVGCFYLVQLEPELDPSRFKVGFTANMAERLRKLRCSATFAKVVQAWPCRSLWEKTAIDCVAAGCQRLHTEVFRSTSLTDVAGRCEQFFSLMPTVSEPSQVLPGIENRNSG